LPIKVLTKQPEQTGIDRVLNIAAAYEQMGKACVVVDAGTAVTVDCCNEAGGFFLEERLERALESLAGQAPRAIVEAVLGAVREFRAAAPQSDDIAALAIRRVTW